jgi:hypothetical protein
VKINELSALDVLAAGDALPVFSTTNGDTRRVAFSTLKTFVNADATASDDKLTQYAAPSATGFTVTITDGSNSVWLILTPTGAFAAGTLVLPAVANCLDRQEILVNSTQAVTTLTINANGATVTGAPTTLAANAFFRLRFDALMKVWYRIG